MKKGLALREQKGFTLIELLIVIAVLGVLAAGVLVAVNPAEQLARARDASRKTAVGQLARAAQAYYTVQGAVYPTENNIWITTIKNAGEIKSVPAAITAPGYTACGVGVSRSVQNGFCYDANSTRDIVIIYVKLESKSEKQKCAPEEEVHFLWSSEQNKAARVCRSVGNDPAVDNFDFIAE